MAVREKVIEKPTSELVAETLQMLDENEKKNAVVTQVAVPQQLQQSQQSQPKIISNINEIITPEKLAAMTNTIAEFHRLWYPLQGTLTWLGHELCKCPMDLHIYQEIIYECKPDVIIECGTFKGGSALYLASICDMIHHGVVLTIDVAQMPTLPLHQRINYMIGSSVDPKVVEMVDGFVHSARKVMVILDSDHSKQHVLDELNIYSNFVTPGQYLIVEDGNVYGHPVYVDFVGRTLTEDQKNAAGNGPYEAVSEFMSDPQNANNFISDKMCERFLMTFNPNGYLRRVR